MSFSAETTADQTTRVLLTVPRTTLVVPLIPSGTTRLPLLRRQRPKAPPPQQAPTPSTPVPPEEEAAAAAARASRWRPPRLRLDEPMAWLSSWEACLLGLPCCKTMEFGGAVVRLSKQLECRGRLLVMVDWFGFIGARVLRMNSSTLSVHVRVEVGL